MPDTLDFKEIYSPDSIASYISDKWTVWNRARREALDRWKEVRQFVFATDTKFTSTANLPWKNTTHIPKICQIRDNLFANYRATLFPKRKWLLWEGTRAADEDKEKARAIRDYMTVVIEQPQFKEEIDKMIYDFIDTGNAIASPAWVEELRNEGRESAGYVGPVPRRVNPLDIVFDTTASNFYRSPKITSDFYTMGELKRILERRDNSQPEMEAVADKILNELREVRHRVAYVDTNADIKQDGFHVDGFDSYIDYLRSDYIEVLRFYGDFYDALEDKLYENHIIAIVDRARVLYMEPIDTIFPHSPFYHTGWRSRQDNIWSMGPLENLLGMQYRLDHVENMKADLMDLTTVPPIKVQGDVGDFNWGPMEKIYTSEEGDVELLNPKADIMQADLATDRYLQMMEEMAGAPKEAMGFRTPGEKTMYEVQRLENAASRIFSVRTAQFEEELLEPLLNGMLELARRNMGDTAVRILDDERKYATFRTLTKSDIQGSGRIRPVAARHFAERAEQLQTVTTMYQSAIAQDPEINVHLSSEKVAKMVTELMDVEEYEIFEPYIRISERGQMMRLEQTNAEEVTLESQTPAGVSADDSDEAFIPGPNGGVNPLV